MINVSHRQKIGSFGNAQLTFEDTRLKRLIGKNIVEVILELPKFNWAFCDGGEIVKTSIHRLTFVDYEKLKPRSREDLYQYVDTEKLSLEILKEYNLISEKNDRCIGLISKVELGPPYEQTEHKFAHIPMLDFDNPKKLLKGVEFLELIKRCIKKTLELTGLILRSSSKDNYNFIGVGTLLNEYDFITFCGLSLGMKYKTRGGENINLVDSRHIGHSLAPMKYMAELNPSWSRYVFGDRFATLRITPKKADESYPIVIDVVE